MAFIDKVEKGTQRNLRGCVFLLVHYFAYGSCMDEKDFQRTISNYKKMGLAFLMNYRLAFTRYEVPVLFCGQVQTVQTYQVVWKQNEDMAPSSEYAQLIWNGLQHIASASYQLQYKEKMKKTFNIDLFP